MFGIGAVALIACSATSSLATDRPKLTQEDQIEIYGIVVARLTAQDDTYDGQLHPTKVFIARDLQSDCPVQEPFDLLTAFEKRQAASEPEPERPPPLPPCAPHSMGRLEPAIELGLAAGFSTRKIAFRFVDSGKRMRFNKSTGEIIGGGVLITLSEIAAESPEVVATNGYVYIAGLASGQTRYEFTRVKGHWRFKRKIDGWVS